MEKGVADVQDIDWGAAQFVIDDDIDVDKDEIVKGLQDLRNSPEMAAIADWASDVSSYTDASGMRRRGSIVHRDQYITPEKVFDQFRLAAHAVRYDDTVGGVADSTESLVFSKIKFDHEDEEQEDLWNQLGKLWDLDTFLRKCWRDLFTYSQFIVAIQPGVRTINVRGRTKDGNKKRKVFQNLKVPVGLRLLEPTRVVPYGNNLFGDERLAYITYTDDEVTQIDAALGGGTRPDDPINFLLLRKLTDQEFDALHLTDYTSATMSSIGLAAYELNPKYVFRHTETKPDYERFANVKMASVFKILDAKTQLQANDRATLIGATHFIVLIKKGSDEKPAKPSELAALKGHARSLAKMPLLIGDHRLNVEIVTPKLDQTLKPERYNNLNAAITSRLYLLFSAGNYTSGTKADDSSSLTRMAARGMESRRHMIRRTIEKRIIDQVLADNPDVLDGEPDLRYQPASIALEFDQARSSFMLELRAAGELSRETILTEFDFDQDDEARRRKIEKEKYDDIFETINPNNQGVGATGDGTQPAPADTKNVGRIQGGAAPGTGQGKAPVRPRKTSK